MGLASFNKAREQLARQAAEDEETPREELQAHANFLKIKLPKFVNTKTIRAKIKEFFK